MLCLFNGHVVMRREPNLAAEVSLTGTEPLRTAIPPVADMATDGQQPMAKLPAFISLFWLLLLFTLKPEFYCVMRRFY